MDSDKILAPVGERRIYSNRGIDLAAEHLAAATGRPFVEEMDERVLGLLDMDDTRLDGPPAHGMVGTIGDLAKLAAELLSPTLLMPQAVELVSGLAYPGLAGVLPGFGSQRPNDWGLGFSLRDYFDGNSPYTFADGLEVYNAGEGASDLGSSVSMTTATALPSASVIAPERPNCANGLATRPPVPASP